MWVGLPACRGKTEALEQAAQDTEKESIPWNNNRRKVRINHSTTEITSKEHERIRRKV